MMQTYANLQGRRLDYSLDVGVFVAGVFVVVVVAVSVAVAAGVVVKQRGDGWNECGITRVG